MSRSTLEPDLSFRPDLIAGVWEAVAYADLFDYPLTHDELFAFLPVRATRARVDATVEPLSARGDWLATDGEYVYFRHRPELPRMANCSLDCRQMRPEPLCPEVQFGPAFIVWQRVNEKPPLVSLKRQTTFRLQHRTPTP